MTDYEVCGHPVSVEFTHADLMLFWAAARAARAAGPALASAAKTQAGLHAVMPGLLERISAQLPTLAERDDR